MLWAKDLNMEPILAVWSGHYLDGTSLSKKALQPYVQSALDELEFLMGDSSTTWGAKRIALGYPEPFQINYVEVGNEDSLGNGAKTYAAYRFAAFERAIHKAYPHMNIMASYNDVGAVHPPFKGTSGDFHEYARPVQMSSQFDQFDNYTTDHKLLLGEYAVIEYDE
jgi:alpha-L-arabinofuranosidase